MPALRELMSPWHAQIICDPLYPLPAELHPTETVDPKDCPQCQKGIRPPPEAAVMMDLVTGTSAEAVAGRVTLGLLLGSIAYRNQDILAGPPPHTGTIPPPPPMIVGGYYMPLRRYSIDQNDKPVFEKEEIFRGRHPLPPNMEGSAGTNDRGWSSSRSRSDSPGDQKGRGGGNGKPPSKSSSHSRSPARSGSPAVQQSTGSGDKKSLPRR